MDHVHAVLTGQKRASQFLELEMIVRHHVGAANPALSSARTAINC